jgi:hypothetical protein
MSCVARKGNDHWFGFAGATRAGIPERNGSLDSGRRMVHNVTHEIKGDSLIITVQIGSEACVAAPPSSSGKTMLVATTGGQVAVQGPKGWALGFALNVMGKRVG